MGSGERVLAIDVDRVSQTCSMHVERRGGRGWAGCRCREVLRGEGGIGRMALQGVRWNVVCMYACTYVCILHILQEFTGNRRGGRGDQNRGRNDGDGNLLLSRRKAEVYT